MKSGVCSCGKRLLRPWGSLDSPIAVVSDVPGFEDVKNGVVYSGTYGEALKLELGKAGIQAAGIRMLTMWKHGIDKECDIDWHATTTLEDLKGVKLVLMLGTECLSTYTGYTASEISGTIVKSKMLPKVIVVAGPSISTLGKTPIGELRLAINKFAEQRRKIK